MESIHKLENTIEEWLKPLPHLPTDWRNWLAKNVWWLVLLGVILSVLGTLMLVVALFTAMSAANTVTSIYGGTYGLGVAQVYNGWWYAASVASLVFLAITVVINAMAVTPLKNMKKKGWDLLFLTFVVGVISSVVSIVLNFGSYNVIASIFSSVIGIVIGAYFLFEIRSHFKSTSKIKQ